MGTKSVFLATAVFGVLALATAVLLDVEIYGRTSVEAASGSRVLVVAPGQSFDAVAALLKDAGVIAHPLKFKLLARLHGDDKRLQSGEYELTGPLSPRGVLSVLTAGRIKLHRLTIPEGHTLLQIADLAAAAGLADRQALLDAARDPGVIRALGLKVDSLEGYLFPETYFFPRGLRPAALLKQMIARFREAFTPAYQARAAELGLTRHEVVTLASIIEKETGAANERPLIASVFHNRLARGMRLESDPTVIYGIPDFDGNLTRAHLATTTPYNTYRIRGLPPGPIANPGRAAIEAALFPATTDYLFFVAKKDRTHEFSTNLRDHRRAVHKYQIAR